MELTAEQKFLIRDIQYKMLGLASQIKSLQDAQVAAANNLKQTLNNMATDLQVDTDKFVFNLDLLTFVEKNG